MPRHEDAGRESMTGRQRNSVQSASDPIMSFSDFVAPCSILQRRGLSGRSLNCHGHRSCRHQPASALLLHILVPNYEVAPAYQALSVTSQDGRTVTGWLAADGELSLTLRTATGAEETLLRREIVSLTASGVSLMPDGLEQTVSQADMVLSINR